MAIEVWVARPPHSSRAEVAGWKAAAVLEGEMFSLGRSRRIPRLLHNLGLGGAEIMGGPPTDPDAIRKLRDKLQNYDMHIIFNIPLPRAEDDLARFEVAVKAASEVGAYGLHAAMTGRRYEQFTTLDWYRKSFEQNQKTVALAEPVLRNIRSGWRSRITRVGARWSKPHG